jgi:hypothetical protein
LNEPAAWAFITYLTPVVAILLGCARLGNTPLWFAAIRGALCLAGRHVARK